MPDSTPHTKIFFNNSGTVTEVSTATPLPTTGSGGGGGAVTVADGADATQGFIADPIVAAGASGTFSAKFRRMTQGLEDLKSLIVLAAGTNILGKVGIDQTTPGTTNAVAATGNAASAAADSGNPVKVGGKYNSTAPTFADGNRGDAQLDVNGNLKVSQATLIAGEDLTVGVLKVEERFSYQNITTATTTTVKSGAGFLHCLTVNTTAAGTIKLWDNTAASGTAIGTLKASVVENTYYYDVSFATGLTVVTAGASDVTVSFR